jgi:hypothetical protein
MHHALGPKSKRDILLFAHSHTFHWAGRPARWQSPPRKTKLARLQNPHSLWQRDASALHYLLGASTTLFFLSRASAHFARAAIMIACSNQATRAAIKIKLENGSGGPLASLRLAAAAATAAAASWWVNYHRCCRENQATYSNLWYYTQAEYAWHSYRHLCILRSLCVAEMLSAPHFPLASKITRTYASITDEKTFEKCFLNSNKILYFFLLNYSKFIKILTCPPGKINAVFFKKEIKMKNATQNG